jgi:hypothetical protein
MITLDDVRRLALALPETAEHVHYRLPAFQVNGKTFVVVKPGKARALLHVDEPDAHAAIARTPPSSKPSDPAGPSESGSTSSRSPPNDSSASSNNLARQSNQEAPRHLRRQPLNPYRDTRARMNVFEPCVIGGYPVKTAREMPGDGRQKDTPPFPRSDGSGRVGANVLDEPQQSPLTRSALLVSAEERGPGRAPPTMRRCRSPATGSLRKRPGTG